MLLYMLIISYLAQKYNVNMLNEELISKLQYYADTTIDKPKSIDQELMDDDIQDLLYLGCLIFIEKSNAIFITQIGLEELGLPPSAGEGTRQMEEFVTAVWHGVLPDWEKQEQEREGWRQDPSSLSPSTVKEIRHLLLTKISDVGLSVRALNCLNTAGVDTIADLVSYTRSEFIRFRFSGRKILNEIEQFLETKNLSFGMDVTKFDIEPKKKSD